MFKEAFLGKTPSHFEINPIVKAYILSEVFLWSAWNFIIPIFAIFVVNEIQGGSVEVAAGSYSAYLISRVIFELIIGRFLTKRGDRLKLLISIFGILLMSFSYLGFYFSENILLIFIFYALLGMGLGIASPAKNALFSMHLDKNKEATEWGIADGTIFICMALATALGGLFVHQFGFRPLFVLAAIVNVISTIPYFIFLNPKLR